MNGRQTKREEDLAYSLLGIFDIHMPLIYGEGRQKALNRLKKEIGEAQKALAKISTRTLTISPKRKREDSPQPQLQMKKVRYMPDNGAETTKVLDRAIFPAFEHDAGDIPPAVWVEEAQEKDPLGIQIWKLYAKAKSSLPNAVRMENLTWRMVAMNIRQAETKRLKARRQDTG